MLFLITWVFAEPVLPPAGRHTGLGAGLAVSAGTAAMSSDSDSDSWLATTSSIRFRSDSGFTLEPSLDVSHGRTLEVPEQDAEGELHTTTAVSGAIRLRPRLATHGSTELFGWVGPGGGWKRERSGPVDAAAAERSENVFRWVSLSFGGGLERWIAPDLSLSLDLSALSIGLYQNNVLAAGAKVPEEYRSFNTSFDPYSRVMLHLYW